MRCGCAGNKTHCKRRRMFPFLSLLLLERTLECLDVCVQGPDGWVDQKHTSSPGHHPAEAQKNRLVEKMWNLGGKMCWYCVVYGDHTSSFMALLRVSSGLHGFIKMFCKPLQTVECPACKAGTYVLVARKGDKDLKACLDTTKNKDAGRGFC